MKKKLAIMALAAVLMLGTGCSKAPSESDSVSDDISDVPPVSYAPPSGSDSDVSKDKGEPTFLICPDGTPVYTSEITAVFTGSDEEGDRHDITLEEAERFAREGGDFTVICSGFVYAYIPENAFNRIDNPDLFNIDDDVIGLFSIGDTQYFGYTGEEISPSTEFIRLEAGDRIGSLTLKSAAVYFGNAPGNMDIREFSDKPGNFLRGCSAEFDGELELSGYLSVSPFNELYNMGGNITFYPDSKSCAKLPMADGRWDRELGSFVHKPFAVSDGYYGDFRLDFGNINELTVDTGTLAYGDSLIKATVKIGDIRFEFNPVYSMTMQHMNLNDIRF